MKIKQTRLRTRVLSGMLSAFIAASMAVTPVLSGMPALDGISITANAAGEILGKDILITLVKGSDNAVLAETTIKGDGENAKSLTDPTWSDHHFEGWYDAETGGNKVTDAILNTYTEPKTLYARWTEIIAPTPTLASNELTYSGTEQTVTINNIGNCTKDTTNVEKATNKGSYKVVLNAPAGKCFDNTGKTKLELSWSIKAKEITPASDVKIGDSSNIIPFTGASLNYAAILEKTAIAGFTAFPANDISLTSVKVKDGSTKLDTISNAGDYTAKFDLNTANVSVKGGGDSFTVDFSVGKIDISGATLSLPTDSQTFTYDGENHKPVPVVKVTSGTGNDATELTIADTNYTAEYYSDSECSTKVSDCKDAGTYYVKVTAKGDGNCQNNPTAKTSFTIERATVAVPTATNHVYDGQSKAGIAADADKYTINSGNSGSDVGTYTAVATPTDNYKWSSGTNVTAARNVEWKINALDLSDENVVVTIDDKASGTVYPAPATSGQAIDQTPTIKVKYKGQEISSTLYTVQYLKAADIADNTKAVEKSGLTTGGTWYVLVTANTAQNSDPQNLVKDSANKTCSFKIQEAVDPSVPDPAENLIYNGTAQNLVDPGLAPEGMTRYFSIDDGETWAAGTPQGTDPKTYTIYWLDSQTPVAANTSVNNNQKVTREIEASNAVCTLTPISALTYNGKDRVLASGGLDAITLKDETRSTAFTLTTSEYDLTYHKADTNKTVITSITNAGDYFIGVAFKGKYANASISGLEKDTTSSKFYIPVKINPRNIAADVSGKNPTSGLTITGLTSPVDLTAANLKAEPSVTITDTVAGNGAVTLTKGENANTANAAYYVTFEDNEDATTKAKAIIHGIGNYTGTLTQEFTVRRSQSTLSFDANGGTGQPSAQNLDFAAAPTRPSVDPTPAAGFKFDDWYTLASGGTKYDFTKALASAAVTAYAQYTLDPTIVASSNLKLDIKAPGATTDPKVDIIYKKVAPEIAASNGNAAVPATMKYRITRVKDENGDDVDELIAAAASNGEVSKPGTYNVIWTCSLTGFEPVSGEIKGIVVGKKTTANYYITYNDASLKSAHVTLEGKTDNVPATAGATVPAPTTINCRPGYHIEWYTASTQAADKKFTFGSSTISGDIELFAKEVANTCQITYNINVPKADIDAGKTSNSGAGTLDSTTGAFSTKGSATASSGISGAPTVKRDYYVLAGWSEDKNATTALDPEGLNALANTTTAKTLFAVWRKANYTISFNMNSSASTPTPATKVVTIDDAETDIADIVSLSAIGAPFQKWATEANGTTNAANIAGSNGAMAGTVQDILNTLADKKANTDETITLKVYWDTPYTLTCKGISGITYTVDSAAETAGDPYVYDSSTVLENGKVKSAKIPTATKASGSGEVFDGWYVFDGTKVGDAQYTDTAFDFNEAIGANTVIYPKFKAAATATSGPITGSGLTTGASKIDSAAVDGAAVTVSSDAASTSAGDIEYKTGKDHTNLSGTEVVLKVENTITPDNVLNGVTDSHDARTNVVETVFESVLTANNQTLAPANTNPVKATFNVELVIQKTEGGEEIGSIKNLKGEGRWFTVTLDKPITVGADEQLALLHCDNDPANRNKNDLIFGDDIDYKGGLTLSFRAKELSPFIVVTLAGAATPGTGNGGNNDNPTGSEDTAKITWVVDGLETVQTYNYGQMPKYNNGVNPTKTGYIFKGWEPEAPHIVAGDFVYTAVFEEDPDYVVTTTPGGQEGETTTTTVSGAVAAPTNVKVSDDGTVSWDASANASYYIVAKVVDGKTSKGSKVTTTSYKFKNLPTSDYKVYVTAYGADGKTAKSEEVTVKYFKAPTNVKVDSTGKVTWTANGGVAFRVVKVVNGITYYGKKTTDKSYKVTPAKGAYTVSVKAYDEDGNILESTPVVVNAKNTLGVPSNVKVSADGTVSWTAAKNAVEYKVVKIGAKTYYSSKVTGTSYKFASDPRTAYTVKVVAFDADGNKAWSSECKVPAKTLGVVSNPKVDAKGVVTWDAAENAVSYKVGKIVGSKTYYTKEVKTTSVKFSNLPKTYKLFVVAKDKYGVETVGPQVKITDMASATNVKLSADKKTVSWTAAEGAVKYQVVKFVNGKRYYTAKTTETSLKFKNAASKNTMIYVIAFDETGKKTSYSEVITLK